MSKILDNLLDFSYKTDAEYRGDTNAVSSHFLMSFEKNSFKKPGEFTYKPYFAQGHLLERLIFEEEFRELLLEEFLVLDFEPTNTEQNLINAYVASEFPHFMKSKEQQIEHLFELCEEHSLWKNIKDRAKLLEKFNYDEFWLYLENMVAEESKKVVSTEQFRIIETAAERVRNLPIIQDVLNKKEGITSIIHPMYKTDVTLEEGGTGWRKTFLGKAQFDLLIFDEIKKKIIILDFKTTVNEAGQFAIDYSRYKYYLQSYWYTNVLKSFVTLPKNEYGFSEYEIEFYFVVVSKTNVNEEAVMYRDDLVDLSIHPKFDKFSLFANLQTLLYEKKRSIESVIEDPNSPLSIIGNGTISLSSVI